MSEKQEMTAKEKLILMIDTLSDNYAVKVIDFIKGLQAGQTLVEKKEGENYKPTGTEGR